jgi:protein TonB
MTNPRSQSTLVSLTIHTAAIALLLLASKQITPPVHLPEMQIVHLTYPIPSPAKEAMGGGGGMHAIVTATAGHLPKIAPRQFVPPVIEVVNQHPKLMVEESIEGTPDLARLPDLGDPLSRFAGISAGTGGPLGIGNGRGTGAGDKNGPGAGSGNQAFGTVYRPGNGVTKPVLISSVEPEFSDEARRSKHSGTVLIQADIDQTGQPRNLRLARSLGMGLDEKALEAVSQWRFKPGTREGKAVTVSAVIEVSFHLL